MNCGGRTGRQSRNLGVIAPACAALLMWSNCLSAQAPADSLAIRLRRAEAAIAVLQQQMGEQTEGGVHTRSRARLEVSGRLTVNAFGNNRKVNNVDNPQVVVPDPAPGVPLRGAGMAIRQSRLGIALSGLPPALGGAVTADMDVDFYGGQFPSSGGRTFPLIRLRTARAFLRWRHAELMIGQESPLVSGLNPVTPAAIGTPAFAAAGNLWLWLPQVRLGVASKGRVRFGAQGAVLAPTSGDAVASFDTDNDAAERAMRPALQARVFAGWGENDTAGEVGCGVHQGWFVPVIRREASRALACDVIVSMTRWVEARGEFFAGQALRGLGGGGIGQNVVVSTSTPLATTGGWAQINLRPAASLHLGAGCGADHPEPGATRRRNDACAVYLTLRPSGPFFVGTELRRIRTEYSTTRFANDHVTLALGLEF